jgi:predicted transcriptional regulator
MKKHRDYFYIMGEMLESAKNESKMFDIMQRVGLSFNQWKKYRGILLKNELMEEKPNGGDRKTYKTLDKGKEFLRLLGELKTYVD